MKQEYEFFWYSTIDMISEKEWHLVFNNSITKSYDFFKASEKANLPKASFLYLKITKNKETCAIIPCFTYTLDLAILAPRILKRTVRKVRYFYKNFMQIKIFGVGSLPSSCNQHIGVKDGLSEQSYKDLGNFICKQIKIKSTLSKHRTIFIKEIPQNEFEYIKETFFKGFSFCNSLPNCFIPILKTLEIPYPNALKRKERNRIKKMKLKFEEQYTWELINEFTEVADVFGKFYFETLERSKNKFETLNNEYFSLLNKFFHSHSFFLAAKRKSGHYEAIGIVLEDEKSLVPLYLGINHDNKVETIKMLHSNSIIRVVEEAELREKEYVVLGQTSYYSKVLSGAVVEKVFLGLYSSNILLNFAIKIFGKQLFSETKVLENIYKNDSFYALNEWCLNIGIQICN